MAACEATDRYSARKRAYATRVRLVRRARGLCPECGRPPDLGHVLCEVCRARHAESQRRAYQARKAAEGAAECTKRPPGPLPPVFTELARRLHVGQLAIREGRVLATVHELVEGAIQSMHREAQPPCEDLRSRRRAAGLCPYCGAPTDGMHVCCRTCISRAVETQRRRRELARQLVERRCVG